MCRGSVGEKAGFKYLGKAKGDPQWSLYRLDLAEPYREPHYQRQVRKPAGKPQVKAESKRKGMPWILTAQQHAADLTQTRKLELANHLKLPIECIDSLFHVGSIKDRREGECWTFPEQDGDGQIIGIVRRRADGRKRAIQGSARGLNITRNWEELEGPIYVPEGASCTLALSALGLAAVGRPSNTGGVAHLAKLFSEVSAEREIVILGEWDAKPDGEWPGLAGCRSVAENLARELKRPIQWSLPPDRAKDVRSWVNIHLRDHALAGAALLLGKQFQGLLEVETFDPPATEDDEEGVVLRTADQIEPGIYDWLVPDYLPKGDLVLLAGDGGSGKSLVTLDLVGALTRGEPAFNLAYEPPCPQHCVLMVCEDDTNKVLYPRLLAANAVLSRVHLVEGIRGKDRKMLPFSLAHIDLLDSCLEKISDVGLVLIDPVAAYLAGTNVNPGRDEEVRTLTEPLRQLAWRHGCCVAMVKHFNKGDSPRAASRIADSAVWRNATRAVYVFFKDDEVEGQRLMLQDKIQGAPPQNGFIYRICPAKPQILQAVAEDLPADWSPQQREKFAKQVTTVEWVGETDRDSNQVSAALSQFMQEIPGETDGPAEFLRKYLADAPALSESAATAGNESLTINKSVKWWRDRILKGRLGGFSAKENKYQGRWWFCLPGQQPPEPAGD